MAHTKHRKKTLRKAEETRLDNRAKRSDMRTAIKKARAAPTEDPANADALMSAAAKRLDKAGKTRLIHPNKASRTKSRLAKAANKARAAASES